ncbi:MAG: hypothetical protein M1812_007717 [Candelaria pacifica]|nr:MAG: hypothetical protein M1812_007717 [Candelaria pacifica]
MADLTHLIQKATVDPRRTAPGVVFQAIDRNGKVINSTAVGLRSLDSDSQSMTMDTTFWIASCTKMITSIALMQLVEQGKAHLDSSDQLENVVPEMAEVTILESVDSTGKAKYREKNNRITLRMLQNHTAGFGYTFFSDNLWNRISQNPDEDEFQGDIGAFKQPLGFEPGTDRAYSIGIDWVGIFVERVSGLKLGDYFERNIFDPLGIKDTAFVPTAHMRKRLAGMHHRDETGSLTAREHLLKPAREEVTDPFHSGGGGLISTAPDYCQILSTLLNDGLSPQTSQRILQKSTIDTMFTNTVPSYHTKYAHLGVPVSRPDLASPALRYEVPITSHQGWGLNFLLVGDNLQRATAPGLSNCFWGMDREKGIGGIVLSQILPFGDPVIYPLWEQLQKVMYEDHVEGEEKKSDSKI